MKSPMLSRILEREHENVLCFICGCAFAVLCVSFFI